MSPSTPSATPARILLVEDIPADQQILAGILGGQGYRLTTCSGRAALESARQHGPEVILLDSHLDGLDSFDLGRQLVHDDALGSVPILFLLAPQDAVEPVFAAGGADYVAKPFVDVVLTTRVAAQLQLARQQREQLQWDQLANIMAHDMRQPLTSIAGHLELLEMSLGDKLSDLDRSDVRQVADAANTLGEMVSAMQDMSRLSSNQLPLHKDYCDVGEMAVAALRALGNITERYDVTLDAGAEEAYVDSELSQRVLTNLINNALRVTPQGGHVSITLQGETSAVRVSVTDSGPGIAPELHDSVFELFGIVRARKLGAKYAAGLSLPFCRAAVEAQGGQIGLVSQVGKGSTFWFTLPKR